MKKIVVFTLSALLAILATPSYAANDLPPNTRQTTNTNNASSMETVKKQKSFAQIKKDAAFDSLLEELLPLSPEQIVHMKKLYDISKQANATPANPPPTPISSSMAVNLSPGNEPPVIRLSEGFVSSLVFVDSTGAPWPITAYSLGDPEAFDIQWDQSSNTLFVQSRETYAHGNMAIQLKDLNTPVMLSFVSGQKQIDYRVDMRVSGRGPNANVPILADSNKDSLVNTTLMSLLDGIPPEGSKKLTLNSNLAEAWSKDNKLYLKTQLTVLSPAWVTTIASADGTQVYEMMPTPNILASKDGQTLTLNLGGV